MIDDILKERGSNYGDFRTQAHISQHLKDVMAITNNWETLEPWQSEALEMIQHKIARILNGDPNYVDSFRDIAGYATLVCNILEGKSE